MKQTIVDVPGMYGDHHVLRLRQILLDTPGVKEVTASAARRRVAVSFDETTTSAEAIREAATAAGLVPGDTPVTELSPKRHEDGSPWYQILDRVTDTERKDREMAGDFRRY